MNLENMSLKELKNLQEKVAIAIFEFNKRQKAEARAAAIAAARAYGFSLEEVVGEETSKKKSKVTSKYAHPENPALTWSGRGRTPKWVTEARAAGKTMKKLEI